MNRLIKFFTFYTAATLATCNVAPPPDVTPERQTPFSDIEVYFENDPGKMLIDFTDGTSKEDIDYMAHHMNFTYEYSTAYPKEKGVIIADVSNMANTAATFEGHYFLESIEPLQVYTTYSWPGGKPNDPYYSKQWHLTDIGTEYSWANTSNGKGIIVAVLDTGVSVSEDLPQVRVLPGKSFVPNQSVEDGNGHGTHVAGTIAQNTNDGVGAAGIAPEVIILPVKVLSNSGMGQMDWIAGGVDYAVAEGAQVINMSLGGSSPTPLLHSALKRAEEAGVMVVAACGNASQNQCGYPGRYEETIGVSAYGPDGELAPYSSYGVGVDIAGPGGNKQITNGGVWQTTVRAGHFGVQDFQGTSMAAPHVAGAAAVLYGEGYSTEEVISRLMGGSNKNAWTPQFGHGKLNLQAALNSVASVMPVSKALVLTGLALFYTTLLGWFSRTSLSFNIKVFSTMTYCLTGLWFLHYLPFPHNALVDFIASSPMLWPIWAPWDFSTNPLWMSAALPMVFAYAFGAKKKFRSYAVGVLYGSSLWLAWHASTEQLHIDYLPDMVGYIWLVSNSIVAQIMAFGLAGVERLEDTHGN